MSVLSGNPSTTDGCASGPLRGVKVIEIASIGPGPFAAMLLADLGAEVVRIDRSGGAGNPLGEGLVELHAPRAALGGGGPQAP